MSPTHPASRPLLAALFLLVAACGAPRPGAAIALASRDYFADWPADASPREVGLRVARNWVARPFGFEAGREGRYEGFVHYAEVATWYGALDVATLSGDGALEAQLTRKYEPFRSADGARRISPERHVDFSIFGALPLALFERTRDSTLLAFGRAFADRQWENPTTSGMTREARYWIDDMYMIPLLQVQAYRAAGDRAYLDRAAQAMVVYLDSLQRPNGLFFHGPGAPFYWGRGNGWIAAGMTELLRALPTDHPQRARVLRGYQTMMASLLAYQSPEGLWRQLVDRPELWIESSGSAMFAFAFVVGVRERWLDAATYGPAARRAWLALVGQLDADANLRDICVGTGKANTEVGDDLSAQYQFYLARPRRTGDLHGQAPVLWTAAALMR